MNREITIKVNYNLDNIINDEMALTPKEKVKEMIIKDMIEQFGWDEGFDGVNVSVIDSE